MTSRALRSFVILGLGLGACTQSGYTLGGGTSSTAVVVDPAEFLGEVVCLEAEGAMRRYVATLVDVSPVPLVPEAGDVTLPSSAPTACWKAVHFERITVNRAYVADIDGYDRTDIRPLSPGSRIQVDAEGRYVPPRWTTSCGRVASPTTPDGGSQFGDAGSATDASDAGAAPAPAPAATDSGDADASPPTRPHWCNVSATVAGSAGDAGDAGDAETTSVLSREGPTCSILSATVTVRDCAPLVDTSGAPPR